MLVYGVIRYNTMTMMALTLVVLEEEFIKNTNKMEKKCKTIIKLFFFISDE